MCVHYVFEFLSNNVCNIIIGTIITIATFLVAWFTYLPIKGHKFSALRVSYFGKLSGYYDSELILFNHKNKTEVICKIYAKLKNGSFVVLDTDTILPSGKHHIDLENPLIIEPYQSKKIYIHNASYFIEQNTNIKHNYLDIKNQISSYILILSDGQIVKAKSLKPKKNISKFEKKKNILFRQISGGKIIINRNKYLEFHLYNNCGKIHVCFENNAFDLDSKKEYVEQNIKQEILKKAKLPKTCTVELDSNFGIFLQTLKHTF